MLKPVHQVQFAHKIAIGSQLRVDFAVATDPKIKRYISRMEYDDARDVVVMTMTEHNSMAKVSTGTVEARPISVVYALEDKKAKKVPA